VADGGTGDQTPDGRRTLPDGWTIGLFLLLTVLLSTPFWISAIATHTGSTYYTVGAMWAPGLSAILALNFRRQDLGALGLGTFGGRFALIGYGLPLLYCTIAYGLTWMLGFGGFPDPAEVARIKVQLGWRFDSPLTTILLYLVLVASTGVIPALARALGEEIGWRGLLAPKLVGSLGFFRGALLAGLIWTAWHVPLLAWGDYHSSAPRWFALACFTVMVVGLSFLLTWLRLRSCSVWPCALLHACHNVLIQSFFTPLTSDRGTITAYTIDEFGFAVPAVVLLFAAFTWHSSFSSNGGSSKSGAQVKRG